MKHVPVEHRIAERIRRLRKAIALSLDALAERAGVSKSLLSKIENRKVSSPISTYSRIAMALGTTVGALLGEGDGETCIMIRRGERKPMPRSGTQIGYVYEALGYKRLDKRMEPFLVTFPSGRSEPHSYLHAGEEFLFLLKGRLEFIHGHSRFVLGPGDCLYLDGDVPHGGRALGRQNAVALFVTAAR